MPTIDRLSPRAEKFAWNRLLSVYALVCIAAGIATFVSLFWRFHTLNFVIALWAFAAGIVALRLRAVMLG